MTEPSARERSRRDDPVCVLQDLPLLWIDVRCAGATMKRRPAPDVVDAPSDAAAVVDRIETELHGEAKRYRRALWACAAICVMPFVFAGVAWSGLYWLPVRILWFPFERGYYGLPWLSLYEWFAYLALAAFFVYGFALVGDSRASTHRLSADYRRLADADDTGRASFVREIVTGNLQRTAAVLRGSAVFSAYPLLLDTAEEGGK